MIFASHLTFLRRGPNEGVFALVKIAIRIVLSDISIHVTFDYDLYLLRS